MSISRPNAEVESRYSKGNNTNPNYVSQTMRGIDINRVFSGEMHLLGAILNIVRYAQNDGLVHLKALLHSENLSQEEMFAKVAVAMFAEEAFNATKDKKVQRATPTHTVYTRMLALTNKLDLPNMELNAVKTALKTYEQIMNQASTQQEPQRLTTREVANRVLAGVLTTMGASMEVVDTGIPGITKRRQTATPTNPPLVGEGRLEREHLV